MDPRQPAFPFVLGRLAYDRRLRGDSYDPQGPSVLQCGRCGGRSTAPLHSRSVRGDELNYRSSTPTFGSTTKLQHIKGVSAQARFLRWFFASGGERAIFSGVETMAAEWVDNSLLTHRTVSEEFLADSAALLPSHGLLYIALAMYDTNKVSADFLRDFGLARLPQNNGVCTRAAQFLFEQQRPGSALRAIDAAIRVDPQSLASRRLRVACLARLNRQTDELAEYQQILKSPEATASDFGQACYLAACLGQGNEADQIFADGEQRFARDADLMYFRGWALLNLGRNAAAASAFDMAEQFLSQGQGPGIGLLAGQAASRWAAGNQKAVETYRTLIARDSDWANSAYVQKLDDHTDLEKHLLLTVLHKTLELHPEFTPRKSNAPQ
jgi:tetratricopeptide (TPR) repeat protein